MIANKVSEEELRAVARAKGMKSLFVDGVQKAMKGITTLEEIKRVTEE